MTHADRLASLVKFYSDPERTAIAAGVAALREVAELRTELTNQRDYTAAVACGIEHLPHNEGEPCLRCERDELLERMKDARVLARECADSTWSHIAEPAKRILAHPAPAPAQHKPGMLARQFDRVQKEIESSPEWMYDTGPKAPAQATCRCDNGTVYETDGEGLPLTPLPCPACRGAK